MLKHKFIIGFVVFCLGLVVLVVIGAANSKPTAIPGITPVAAAGTTAPADNPSSPADDQTPTSSAIQKIQPGTSLTVGDNQDNTEGTVVVDKIIVTQRPSDSEFGSAPANGWYVIVKVSAKADASYTDGFDVNTFDFVALTPQGRQFTEDNGHAYEALNDSQENDDITGTLGAGQSSSGWLAFDVSRPHGVIAYAPNYDGQPLVEWKY